MTRSLFSWFVAIALTAGAGYYFYLHGPSRPLQQFGELADARVEASLPGWHQGRGKLTIPIIAPHTTIHGRITFKQLHGDGTWQSAPLKRQGDRLVAEFPPLTDGSRIEYYLDMRSGTRSLSFPANGSVLLRYRSEDPFNILWFHIVVMAFAIAFSFRAGVEGLYHDGQNRGYTLISLLLLLTSGLALGPASGKILYGIAWQGFPIGGNVTHNLAVALVVVWGLATFREWNHPGDVNRPRRNWLVILAIAGTIITLWIPHAGDSEWTPSPRPVPGNIDSP